mgnify:CR=1 FL=1
MRQKLQETERANEALTAKNKELAIEIAGLKKGASASNSREKNRDKVLTKKTPLACNTNTTNKRY